MDLQLRDKVAVVTGGARGIGRAIGAALAAEGARLAVIDLPDAARGDEALFVAADVGDFAQMQRAIDAIVAQLGPVDVLVNNAGIATRQPILETAPEDWERVLRTNLNGCFHGARAVAPGMIARGQGGRIVNTSSIHGRVAKAGMGAYCASKAAIDMFTKQLAVELAPHRITVNAVAPGTIRTEINVPLYRSTKPEDVALQQAVLRRVPAGRFGEVGDIGAAVAFLASGAAGYITGETLYVDGGYAADGTGRM